MSQPGLQLSTENTTPSAPNSSFERRWELGLVLLVIVLPLVLTAVGGLRFGMRAASSTAAADLRLVITIVSQLGGLALLWYVLRRTGRSFGSLGLRWSGQDGLNGLVLAFLGLMASATARYFLGQFYFFWTGAYYHRPDVAQYLFAGNPSIVLLLLAVVPFFEEIIVRGYLTTEFEHLTGSIWFATIASVLLQASYHVYQGWISAIALFFLFSVFGIYYARTKRLFAVIVAHGAVDFIAFLLYLRQPH